MLKLPDPSDILDLADGQSITLKITSWEEGWTVIHPKYPGAPESQRINVLRVHVPPPYKETVPDYWDITATRLIAGMKPYLTRPGFETLTFTITKHGIRPTARFTLKVE